jgi:AcrR family transcriptional regulator
VIQNFPLAGIPGVPAPPVPPGPPIPPLTVTGWQPAADAGEHKAETRRRLLEAATSSFMALGPDEPLTGITLDEVAVTAGVSVEVLEMYFPSMYDLMCDLAEHMYVRAFRSYPRRRDGSGVAAFMRAHLDNQAQPEARLLWRLGTTIADDYPEGVDAAHWHMISEVEKRLIDEGASMDAAHERARVLAPALQQMARRVVCQLATRDEVEAFLVAAGRCAVMAT